MSGTIRVAIDCRIGDPRQGVGTAVLALAKALSSSRSANQEYTFIVREPLRAWLSPYVQGACKLKGIPEPGISKVKAALRWATPLRHVWRKIHDRVTSVPVTNGFIESEGFDLVHFPTQAAYLTNIPSIYQPWDLQHLHYPEFFPKAVFAQRELEYRAFCLQVACVCVQAEWTKRDVIDRYQISREKITVIPWGSVFEAYSSPDAPQIEATREKYGLPV